ncbi:MAG TPA: AAA family ATPase [Bacteroidales bacterium]|nr:AAA family ATPase [Bacteroidales bacterium]
MDLRAKILAYFPYTPTSDQHKALDSCLNFFMFSGEMEVLLLKGYAGTGKTALISAVVRFLTENRQPCVLMAPTGRAAKVFASYSGHAATTIHKKIYRQKEVDGTYGRFDLNDNLHENTFFFVDEASMISNENFEGSFFGSGRLLDDLLRYVYSGKRCRLVMMGDTAQLPPVGSAYSPALDRQNLESLGMQVAAVELTQVVRQEQQSLLLDNATDLRRALAERKVTEIPLLSTGKQTDVISIRGEDLTDALQSAYDRCGIDECKVICRSNKQAVRYNLGIRSRIFFKEEELSTGDLLLVAKNNYFWSQSYKEIPFIANGDLIEVRRVRKITELYGFRFADLEVRFPETDWEMEVKVILDSLVSEAPALDQAAQQKLYEAVLLDYADVRSKKALYAKLRVDPWFNALQVKYGYAMTCHKAQGGQWKEIFLDQGWVTPEMLGAEYYRWLYTALTRAVERIYLVNFKDEYLINRD